MVSWPVLALCVYYGVLSFRHTCFQLDRDGRGRDHHTSLTSAVHTLCHDGMRWDVQVQDNVDLQECARTFVPWVAVTTVRIKATAGEEDSHLKGRRAQGRL